MGIYVKGVDMPKQDELLQIRIYGDGKVSRVYDIKCQQIGTAIETTQVVPIEDVWQGVQPLKDKILELEEKLYLQNEWIPCSKLLPYEHICDDGYVEPSEKVLVCTDSRTILTSRYWGNRQSKAEEPDTYADWVDIDWWHNVIAWMPLPKPYREGGDTE